MADFNGFRVLSLESRMAQPTERLILQYGGQPQVAPSLKEVPLSKNNQVFSFFENLKAGLFDLFILMTGVGTRTLLKLLEEKYSKEDILEAFNHTKVVVRGPKPTSVCKIHKIPISVTVPPPNTWQEIIQILSEDDLLRDKQVALLEYGRRDENFLHELSSRGAQVTTLPVYKWELPEDVAPLKQAIQDIIDGKVDLLLQTSAVQMDHLLKVTKDKWEELKLRRALARVAIFSIGPTTSNHLRELQIFPDYEVFPNKLDQLVQDAAKSGLKIRDQKRVRAESAWVRISLPQEKTSTEPAWLQSNMMKACRRESTKQIPIWLMRQAGRYMEEYQLVRRGTDFLEFCKNVELCTEATLTAVERLGVDAAIIFSDILLILEPMGAQLSFKEGFGPVIASPIRTLEQIEKLRPVIVKEDLSFTLKAIKEVRRQMSDRLPLIGFAGAPFTLASYLIEGKGSRNYIPTKTLMHSEPKAWHQLMEKLSVAIAAFLKAQVEAGCQILQIFDSWVGCLSPEDYEQFVLPHMRQVFLQLPEKVPTIHFGTGTATLLNWQKKAGGDVIGLDWRIEISKTWDQLGGVAIQGNLDPVLLFSPIKVIQDQARKILQQVAQRPGFIFNLGHGILPETPVDHVMALVDYVHQWRS